MASTACGGSVEDVRDLGPPAASDSGPVLDAGAAPHDTGTVDVAQVSTVPTPDAAGDAGTADVETVTCPPPLSACQILIDPCTNLSNDNSNCGQCGHVCLTGQECVQGQCTCSFGKLCGSACVDTTGDPSNCGACGAVCPSATPACLDGTCGLAPTVVVTSQQIDRLAIDANNLYWTHFSSNLGTVMQMPKAGGPVLPLVSTDPFPAPLAVEGSRVYWGEAYGDGASLKSIAIGGGPVTVLAVEISNVIAIHGSTLCFAGAKVACVPTSGGAPVVLSATPGNIFGMVVDATRVYWAVNDAAGSIQSAPTAGGVVTTLAANQDRTFNFTSDATNLYWTTSDGAIRSVPKAGGATTTLSQRPGIPESVVENGGVLYWTEAAKTGSGNVMKMPVGGGPPQPLAWSLVPGPGALVVDDAFVYWESAGTLYKVPK